MDDPTQARGDGDPLAPAAPVRPDAVPDAASATAAPPPFDAATIQHGLLAWLAVVAAGGITCLLLGHVEGGLFFAAAGAFALAQATDAAATFDRYRAFVREQLPRRSLHGALFRIVVRAIVPAAGAAFYAAFGYWAWSGDEGRPHVFAAAWCAAAALTSLALVARPVADAATRALFGGSVGRTRRLTARIVVLALLLPVPATILSKSLMASLAASGTELADPGALTAQLLGELAIAFAGVGWLVRRDGRATLARLGLTAMRPAHWLVAALAVAALIGLNTGTEWLEQHFFVAQWLQDRDVTRLIAGKLPLATSLLLGLSAGVGEEVAVRGALQPRLGIVLCAIVFAAGHVQYSWFGMATIGLLGILLGTVRARANTTTAIMVHAAYDIFAALTANT